MQDNSLHFKTLLRTRDKIHALWFYRKIRERNVLLVVCCSSDCMLFQLNFSQAKKRKRLLTVWVLSLGLKYYTLVRTADPVKDRGKFNCIPCLGQQGQKTIPCPAACPRIAQVRECLPGIVQQILTLVSCFSSCDLEKAKRMRIINFQLKSLVRAS